MAEKGMRPPSGFKKVNPIDYRSAEMSAERGPTPRTITFYDDELPVGKWKVGEEYKVVLKIKQISTKIKDHGPMKGKTCAEFELQEVADASNYK